MSNIIPFSFSGHDVRVVQKDGEPLFVGKDICDALGFSNSSKAMDDHCRGVTKRYPISDSLGRTQKVRVLTEGDVMRLIVRSKLPAAQEFEALVFDTILPTIRRTGSYIPDSSEALTAQATGGIVKSVVAKALRTEGPNIVRAILAEQGFSLVEDYKTANGWLIEYKAVQKGRSGLTQKVGRTLRKLCEELGIPRHRCAVSGKWLYPSAVARPFFQGTGGHWVRMHNAAVALGQSAIRFKDEVA
ncbi:Bro-N domain-containing protein [Bombella sp. TMW 2.2559]|uniref:Bro-N domain-containing protein n=1 Tax=Bombella dulcis TaxID=2967339 RepID=A0ABT3WGU9_9PROT|nr:Bro-N domain-containing protein [Bombella dulcis]MCX5617009.1 Bro-N domain-containing protein [Bombella dulcis]